MNKKIFKENLFKSDGVRERRITNFFFLKKKCSHGLE